MRINRRTFVFAALAASAWAGVHAQSADYPAQVIKIIVPFTPGSGSDTAARFFGDHMSRALGQSVIVENRPGANGLIALQAVKNQPADGYTVLLASNSPMAVNPLVFKNLPYDPSKDFKPVFGLTRAMNVIIVSNESPYKTFDDLVAAARKQPLMMGTYSAGYELAGHWLADLTGSQFTNVAYKGQAQITTDVMGHHLDFGLVDLGGAIGFITSGKLRALAVSGENRNPDLPDVPTVREQGFKDYVQYSWVSFYVRSQTSDHIVNKLADAVRKATASDEARQYVRSHSVELMAYPPQEMARFHHEEIERFRKIAEKAGITPQ
ncbi:MAG: tripartite tricarboxylate transporter substrate binding protein [Burkholderiaceae bacterium]|jgi:tripartite-type tricarboxylate transporter receptor subunit TctC|nr:tripartite tricarboxylate transporter substrate binding protein [Burkholderiaceae bacterium]